MEKTLDLKPLRVKITYPGVDYVMVLVDRCSLIKNLIKEIQETLGKLFPHARHGPINSVRKDNGKVLLPEWYPIDPMLKDEEEVMLCYDPLVSSCSPSTENEVDCIKGDQNSSTRIQGESRAFLQCDSIGHSEQSGNESGPAMQPFIGIINKENSSDSQLDLDSAKRSDVNAQLGQKSLGRVFENDEVSSGRKRKGEIVGDEPSSSKTDSAPGRTAITQNESLFKKFKANVIESNVISKGDVEGDEAVDANVIAKNEISYSTVKTDAKKSDGAVEDSEEHLLIQSCRDIHESEISATTHISETSIPVSSNATEPIRNSVRKKKKHKKEHKAKMLIEETAPKDLATEWQDSALSSKLHKKKKHAKKSEPQFTETSDRHKQNGSVITSTPVICKTALGTRKGDEELLNEFTVVDEEKSVGVSKRKKNKSKKAKERSNDEEKEKYDEPFCSGSSVTVSDLKESGIGSGSPSYGVDKTINKVSDQKDTPQGSGEAFGPNPQRYEDDEGPGDLKSHKDESIVNEPFALSRSDSDLTIHNPQHVRGTRSIDIQSKQNGNECVAHETRVNERLVEPRIINTRSSSRKSKLIESIPTGKVIDIVDENAPSKPSFDYETDAETKQIQTRIRRVVCNVVEESDYSQSLLEGPLELTNLSGSCKLPGGNDESKDLANLSAVGTNSEMFLNCNSKKDIKAQEQNGNRGNKKSSKESKSNSRKRSLKDGKQGESNFSAKSLNDNTIKRQKEISTGKRSNMKDLKDLEEMSGGSWSDTSSMSFSDCVSHDLRKNKEKKEKNKKLSKHKDSKSPKTKENPKEDTRRKKMLYKQDSDGASQEKKAETMGEKTSVNETPVKMCAGKEIGLIDSKDGTRVEISRNGNSLDRKKSRRKIKSSAKKSVAKVQNWLSQLAEDVPTETASSRNLETEQDEDRTSEHSELDNWKNASLSKVNESELANMEVCKGNETIPSKKEGLNDNSAQVVNENEIDNKSGSPAKDGSSEKVDNCDYVNDVFLKKPVKSPCKKTGMKSSDSHPNRKTTLNSPQNIDVGKDSVMDLKFNALLEDGGSVLSSRVTKPLRPRTSFFQKSLTGFLSRDDQKRFQSKLQSQSSPPIK